MFITYFTEIILGVKKSYGKKKIVVNPKGYKATLASNRIYLRTSDLPLPERVGKFVKDVVSKPRYKETPRPPILYQKREHFLMKVDHFIGSKGGSVEIFMKDYLPLTTSSANLTTTPERVNKDDKLRIKILVDSGRQPYKFSLLEPFPYSPGLSQPYPDLLCGYTKEILPLILPDITKLYFDKSWEINSETTCFPYLIAEAKCAASGSLEVAELQILGDCALALSTSKYVLRSFDNYIFGITYDSTVVSFYVMWMEGTLETTSFVMQKITSFLTSGDFIFTIQDYLLNIHCWAGGNRLERIQENLIDESVAMNAEPRKPRPPPVFEGYEHTVPVTESVNPRWFNTAAAKRQESAAGPASSNAEAEGGEPDTSIEVIQI
ncbi:hypothetical protein GGR54DRAFT_616135 [Hypoxylon sp. NC1633]|nr:hypothetical protein GGR54DRAFT_616135 [Hypoxylon sp. NC1633]